jgi:1-acyl-sn-glycerol-3-phosphate acyltransferase
MLPIRLVLVVLYTAVLGSAAILVCLVVPGGRAFWPLARLWAWLLMTTCGVAWRPLPAPGSPGAPGGRPFPARDRPHVYVANHQSQFDIPALILSLPQPVSFVTKRELLFVPIFGQALWLAGFVFVDRRDRERAIRSLERAARRIRRGASVLVFAEGTRSPDGRLLPFKKGGFMLALAAGAPIVPVTVKGGREVLPKGSLRVRPGRIDVVIGEPIETAGRGADDRDALIDLVRGRIAAAL